MVPSSVEILLALSVALADLREDLRFATLKRKLQGYWNYYGVMSNSEQTWNYVWFAKRLVYKWLNRRSKRKSFTVRSFVAAWERWQMPDPQVNEKPWPTTARQHQPRPV